MDDFCSTNVSSGLAIRAGPPIDMATIFSQFRLNPKTAPASAGRVAGVNFANVAAGAWQGLLASVNSPVWPHRPPWALYRLHGHGAPCRPRCAGS